jgi:DNA-binding beta-propeller fold protein YncE
MLSDLQSALLCDIKVPGKPFGVIATPDGKWVLVSLVGPPTNGIAVLHHTARCAELSHIVPLEHLPLGVALSYAGDMLAVAHFRRGGISFLDVERATANASDSVLGHVPTGEAMGSIEVTFSPNQDYAFVSEEKQAAVSVVSLRAIRASGYTEYAVVGRVPVDHMPIGMAISPDGRSLYVTSEATDPLPGADTDGHASEFLGWPVSPLGTLTVVDMALAQSDPAQSVVAQIPAGENPVRVALSHGGRNAWITSRASNQLLVLDTVAAHHGQVFIRAAIPVGLAPVGVAVVANDTIAVVANSNRFANDESSNLSVIDVEAALVGQRAVIGTIDVGKFPREFCIGSQGNTLFLTNFRSGSVTMLDVTVLSDALR